jgi:hypothetical protein
MPLPPGLGFQVRLTQIDRLEACLPSQPRFLTSLECGRPSNSHAPNSCGPCSEHKRPSLGSARHDRFGEAGGLGHHFVGLGYPNDFFDCRFAFQHPTPAVLTQGEHALGDGGLF